MARSKKNNKSGRSTDTLIGQGAEMEGTLLSESNLRIEGNFSGSIETKGQVIVGESAVAKSHIKATEIVIAGKVYGDISTSGRLTITPTGQMFGDVHASSLIIMEGGVLNGISTMEQKEPAASSERSKLMLQPEAG